MDYLVSVLKSNEFQIGVVTSLVVAFILWLISIVRNKSFSKPKIVLEYTERKRINSPDGIAGYIIDSDNMVDVNNSVYHYTQTFEIKLIIHNHSKIDAYYPVLEICNKPVNFSIEDIDVNVVIPSNSKIELKGEYKFSYKRKPDERYKNVNKPSDYENLYFILSYQNENKGKFYVRLKNNESKISRFKLK